MEKIKAFLLAPDQNKDEFWESDSLIWIDWRECDEDIPRYMNEVLPEEAQIDYQYVEIEKERGVDIILKKNGVSKSIPYQEDCTDRDTTLRAIQEYLLPKYQIRWFLESLGSDTLGFCVLSAEQWKQLEQEFGLDHVAYYFVPIQEDSVMFEMDMDEVCRRLEERRKY